MLGFAIDKYCYISLRPLPPFFEHRHRLIYSKIENVNDISEFQHPAVRHVLQECGVDYGTEIHHDGDLPARSGLGSSSSFTVGLLNVINAQAGRMVSKDYLAREAIRIEQDVIKENVGSQDQIWAAYGGMNRIDFLADGSFSVQPLILPPDRSNLLMGRLMLFFTGFSRYAHDVAGKKIANLNNRADHIRTMVGMVDEAQAILTDPNREMREIGELLHEGWQLKRDLSDAVTTTAIDAIYDAGRSAGAVGGKLLGAGGGGFILFYVEPELQAAVSARLSNLIEVRFDIDRIGSRIVLYEPNGLGPR